MYVDDVLAISMDPTAILKSMEGDILLSIRLTRLSRLKCILEPSYRRKK